MSLTSYLWRRQLRASTRVFSSLIQLDSAQTTSHQLHFQFHPTRGKKSYKKKLIECLDTEIQHEKDNYETDPIVKQGPPNGFTLLDMKETNIVLHKQYQNEDITIEASFVEQPPPEKENSEDPESPVSYTIILSVSIQKQGMDKKLSLECETDGGYMSIRHVGLEPNSGPNDTLQYTGPMFGELDDTLQDTFNNWIEERGIDDVLGDYLVQKLHDVEQEYYMGWLETTQSFISHE